MARQYYTLVAGLREWSLDADNKGLDIGAVIEEVREALSEHDRRQMEFFYTYYDIGNIINLMSGREQFSELGNFTRDELEQEMKAPVNLPGFISDILAAYANPDDPEFDQVDRSRSIEKALFTAYYDLAEKSECRFTREWYAFDRNLRNVIAAFNARRLGLPVADELVGEGYVAETLGRSSAADFGLKGELDYTDRLLAAIGQEENLLQKEHLVDLIRWEMADDLTTFDYFDLDKVLGYLAKLNIIHRWMSLDEKVGRGMFRRLIDEMSAGERLSGPETEGM